MDLTDSKAVILEVKRTLRAVPPGSAGPVLDLIDENGGTLRTVSTHWNRRSKGKRNAENEIEFEFKLADQSGLAADLAKTKQVIERQGPEDAPTATSTFQRKRVVKPKIGESQIWLLFGIEPDFTVEAKFHAP